MTPYGILGLNFTVNFYIKIQRKIAEAPIESRLTAISVLAGAEGLEPSARGFGDRCSTN